MLVRSVAEYVELHACAEFADTCQEKKKLQTQRLNVFWGDSTGGNQTQVAHHVCVCVCLNPRLVTLVIATPASTLASGLVRTSSVKAHRSHIHDAVGGLSLG